MAEESSTSQKLTAEVIGTFVLVFFGCGSVVYAGATQAPSTITTIGLTFGLAVMVMVYAFGRVSGGHFNPAVSLGAAISGRMAWKQVPLYVVAQLVGAILGALVLFALMHGFEGFDSDGNMGQNAFGDIGSGYAWWAAFLLELVMTAIFVWVILAVTDERNEHPAFAPLAIGLTLAAIHFVAIPATGTSVNPARSIGPALFAGGDSILQLWLFIVAPLVGAAIAGLTYPLLFGHASEPVPGSGLNFSRGGAAAVPGYGAPDQFQQEWNQQDPQDPYAAYRAQGWEWDAAAQEWRHESQRPAAPAQQAWQQPEQGQQAWQPEQAQQAWQPEQQAPQPNAQPGAEQQWQQPEPQQWPGTDQGESRTQIRPPEGQ